ncbi:MAG: NAD(P)H-dependent glycerol-3-phosphate dehydrogenase [Alphaproteobacteria bacterium]
MTESSYNHFGIVGGGAWGVALGIALLRAGRHVTLWARSEEVVAVINTRHENPAYLPGIPLDHALFATTDRAALQECDVLLLTPPAQHLRGVTASLFPRPETPLIIGSKGIEQGTLMLMSEVVAAVLPQHPIGVLSGPTFAAEVARGLPAAVTLAMRDQDIGKQLIQAMGSRSLRPYLSDDIAGTQIGGAVKNVLAIACGIVEGRGFGDNARAAIMTRGLSELTRLGRALGGKMETFMGLSGMGDLVLTCAGAQSRNMSLGYALGQGRALDDILAERRSVAEGVSTASAAVARAAAHGVELPICAAVDRILNQGAAIEDEISALLTRPLRNEGA